MKGLILILAFVCLALLAASYLGGIHPLGDSLAVFRLWLAGAAIGLSALLYLMWMSRTAALLCLLGSVAAVPILGAFYAPLPGPDPSYDPMIVYSKNTLGGRGDDEALVADIRTSGADVVLLQEVSATRSSYAGDLSETHPAAHFCQFSDWSGIGIISRWPIDETYCSPSRSIAAARIMGPEGPFWAVSVHLVWPYPHDQWPILERALPFLDSIDGWVVVGGDFNMVPWAASVRRIAQATGTERHGPLHTTLRIRGIPLQIDHVFSTGRGGTDLRPLFGTDHHGVLARITWRYD